MKLPAFSKLDNHVWHCLSEDHKKFAIEYPYIKFYQPEYCVFGAFGQQNDILEEIDAYAKLVDTFFLVGEKPRLSAALQINSEVACLQMVLTERIKIEIKEEIIPLQLEHLDILYHLISTVYPGYFRKKTALMGDYFGIFKEGELVAVTGERLKMNDFTEISSVVTHPKHTGKGYAQQLVAHTANHIFEQQKTPYLHVSEANFSAINLYRKLGFYERRKMSFWQITKAQKD